MKNDPHTPVYTGNFEQRRQAEGVADVQADVLSAFGVHLLTLPVEKALGYVRRHPGTLAYVGGVLIASGAPLVSQAAALLAA